MFGACLLRVCRTVAAVAVACRLPAQAWLVFAVFSAGLAHLRTYLLVMRFRVAVIRCLPSTRPRNSGLYSTTYWSVCADPCALVAHRCDAKSRGEDSKRAADVSLPYIVQYSAVLVMRLASPVQLCTDVLSGQTMETVRCWYIGSAGRTHTTTVGTLKAFHRPQSQ